MWGLGICSISLSSFFVVYGIMWRYINGIDIYCFGKCCFDSNHFEFTVDVDLPLGYVLPNDDRDTSRRSVSIFV